MVFIILLLAVLVAFAGRKKGKVPLIMGFFILFTFAALRYMYGNDYSSYYNWFLRMKAGWESPFDYEFLYNLLTKLSPSFPVLVAVTSAVFLFAAYKLVDRNVGRQYAWISLFIFVVNPYLFLMNLSAIRQSMAMVFFIAAIPFGREKKILRYVVTVLLGAMFHKSALVLLPVYFLLSPSQFKRKYVLAVVGMMALLLCVFDLNRIASLVASWFGDRNYMVMLESGSQNSLRATLLTGVYFVYVLMNMEKLEGKSLVYAKLSLVGYTLGVLAFRISMLTRVQMYFDIFSIVTLPTILETVNRQGRIRVNLADRQETVWKCINKYVLPTMIFAIYLLRMYSFFTNPRWQSFVTYQTIFSA